MATLSRGQTFSTTETITNTKLHNLIDLGSVSGIVNADISAAAAIADTKLADITSGGKVRGSALLNLASIPSGAGTIPLANLSIASFPASGLINLASIPTGQGIFNYQAIISSLASGAAAGYAGGNNLVPITSIESSWLKNLSSIPTNQGIFNYQALVASLASGRNIAYGGGQTLVPSNPSSLSLISTTSWNGTNSGDIAVTSGRKYLAIFQAKGGGSGSGVILLRVNSSSAGSYQWLNRMVELTPTPSETLSGSSTGTSIQLVPSGGQISATSDSLFGKIELNLSASVGDAEIGVFAEMISGATTAYESTSVRGMWVGGAVTDFEIVTTNAIDATLYLYELSIT